MLEHLRNRFDYWRSYRRTVYELTGLDRHMLADMRDLRVLRSGG